MLLQHKVTELQHKTLEKNLSTRTFFHFKLTISNSGSQKIPSDYEATKLCIKAHWMSFLKP